MDKSMVKGIMIGATVVLAVSAAGVTSYKTINKPVFAEVLAAKEVTQTIETPRKECEDVPVSRKAPVKDEQRIAGTALGAIAGGLLGSTIGGGSGKKIATVAGAAAGGYAGNKVQKNMQEGAMVTTTERRCRTVHDTSVKHLGFDVTYRLHGEEGVVRMDYDPGKQIPVKDGQLVLLAEKAR